MRNDLKDKLRTESNFKFVAAAAIVLGLIFMLVFSPRGKKYYMAAEEDVKVAMQICQNSTEWVKANKSRLKMGSQSKLDHIKVDGEIPKLKHAKTPQVIFIASGFNAPNMTNHIFCEIIHPATKKKYFFNYDDRSWSDKARMRR